MAKRIKPTDEALAELKALVDKLPDEATVRAAREAANERADKKRRQNAEKQARHRKRMIEEGARQVKAWVKPPPPGKVPAFGFAAAPLISESSAGVCERNPAIEKALERALSGFMSALRGNDDKLPPGGFQLCQDIEALLAPLGYKAPY
jgi:hypothetical protein